MASENSGASASQQAREGGYLDKEASTGQTLREKDPHGGAGLQDRNPVLPKAWGKPFSLGEVGLLYLKLRFEEARKVGWPGTVWYFPTRPFTSSSAWSLLVRDKSGG